ncbi:MAG: hypothetical protein ACE37K_11855 [Planctomycetota bacterium]
MNDNHDRVDDAREHYSKAHSIHYKTRDLLGALHASDRLIESYPASLEAGYARSQQVNIVNAVVPTEKLHESQMALALRHLRADDDASSVGQS